MSEFSDLLRNIRKSSKIRQENLCKGICSASELSRIESGQREAGFLLQSALLARLGFSSGGYNSYVYKDEYDRYKTRKYIIESIERESYSEVPALIEQYREGCFRALGSGKSPSLDIELQFCEAMHIQLMRGMKASDEAILPHCISAVTLSMKHLLQVSSPIGQSLLTFQEIDILLEYRHALTVCSSDNTDYSPCYKELYEWILHQTIDYNVNSIFLPKIAIYYAGYLKKKALLAKNSELLIEMIVNALSALRNSQRCFYLGELTDVIQDLYSLYAEIIGNQIDFDLVKATSDTLRKIYRDYDREFEMRNDVHLYYEKRVFFIGDVISRRRKTLLLTNEKLCEGICDIRVLQGLVSGKTQTQSTIVKALLGRLRLPEDFTDFEIASKDRAVLKTRWDIPLMMNNGEFEECRKQIDHLRKKLPIDNLENRQAIQYFEASFAHRTGKLSDEEYVLQLNQIISLTISLEKLLKAKEIYLSPWEICCIVKLAVFSHKDINDILSILKTYLISMDTASDAKTNYTIYTFILDSIYRNQIRTGKYSEAINTASILMDLCLTSRDVKDTYSFIYNYLRAEYHSDPTLDYMESKRCFLKKAQLLSTFCNDSTGYSFFSKLDEE